jgi:hypothetical protein
MMSSGVPGYMRCEAVKIRLSTWIKSRNQSFHVVAKTPFSAAYILECKAAARLSGAHWDLEDQMTSSKKTGGHGAEASNL